MDYKSVTENKTYDALNAFCDDKGNINSEFSNWRVQFSKTDAATRVNVEITFESVEALEKIIEMGFKEGFTMAHSNLDELLATQKV